MELGLRTIDRHICCDSIIVIPFAEIIGLHLIAPSSAYFDIDFIKIVRKKDKAAHYPFSLSHFGNVLDATKEPLEIRMHGGGIVSLRKRELGSIGTIIDVFVVGKSPVTRL